MSIFREMVGLVGSPTGRDCCIAVINDVRRAATFALGAFNSHQFAPAALGTSPWRPSAQRPCWTIPIPRSASGASLG